MAQKKLTPNYLRLSVPGETVSRETIEAIDPLAHNALAGLPTSLARESLASGLYVSMRMKEAMLVSKAFDTALGYPDPYPQSSRESLIEMLSDDYQLFGIASGAKVTEQLVRRFETLAVSQAKEHLGRGRK